ncbi:hypothetical protein [Paracoccus aminovorans]|nr:hypothetical protein [Paracoccus aminovorans]
MTPLLETGGGDAARWAVLDTLKLCGRIEPVARHRHERMTGAPLPDPGRRRKRSPECALPP